MVGAHPLNKDSVLIAARLTGLGFLLVCEVLLLTIRFDAAGAMRSSQWIRVVTDNVSTVPQMLAVVFTATLIFGGKELSGAWQWLSLQIAKNRSWRVWLATQLACFLIFALLTRYVLEINQHAAGFWYVAWLISGVACGGSWLCSVLHPADWMDSLKRLRGPICLGTVVGLAGWIGGHCARDYWRPLAFGTFQSVSILLHLAGLVVVQDLEHLVIGTTQFSVRIAPQCSGYEGMGLAFVFVTTYLWLCRDDHYFPRSLVLIPVSILLMFLANSVRIAALIAIGHLGWEEFAVGGFHSQAGWLAFNAVTLGLLAFARVSPYFCRTVPEAEGAVALQSVPMLMPFVALTMTIMGCGALQTGFDWFYPLRVLAVVVVLCLLVKRFPAGVWRWTCHWMAPVLGFVVYVIWIVLEPQTGVSTSRELFDIARSQSPALIIVWLVFRVFGSVVTVPLAEELAFRGYLLPWLQPNAGDRGEAFSGRWSWFALLSSSVAFGVLHPGRFVAGTLAGCFFGAAYYRRGVLMDAVLAHATTNMLIAVHVLLTGDWNLWS